jgi:hypothetical protein
MTSPRALRFRFIAAICAGSFLLFLVQPMIARMALPRLGGAPAVWNSAMLVYQALLLGGYAYAHVIGRLAPRTQAALHIALLLVAALMLPIGLSGATPSASANPFFWVPYLFVASIGPLFFVISAQAPLLQRWYSDAGGGDPYPLYAASNLGSFGGLIAYPLLVEPLLPLKGQSWLWSAGYGLVVLLVAVCALVLPKVAPVARTASTARYDMKQVLLWIALAAVPSGLMLSTTTHLTTDIVAMPLLWVLPLGLYLLSFSIAFAENRALPTAVITVAPLILMIGGGVAFAAAATMPWFYASIGLMLLFVVAVALHAMLYERRPAPELLTGFYLAMSAGGVLGGIFCALVAPVIFDWAYEHPVLIIAAGLLVAREPLFAWTARIPARMGYILALVAILASMVSGRFLFFTEGQAIPEYLSLGIMVLIVFIGLAVIGRRIPFALVLVSLMLTLGGWNTVKTSFNQQARTRSFFGIYTIGNSGGARFLQHGTTLHGEQSLMPGREREPLTYYAPKSGVGLAMAAAPAMFGPAARIGVVGLGAGTLACYAQPGQDWRFYEIDPAIAAIAKDTRKFTFLSRCLPGARIVIGDARLTIAADRDPPLDLLVIDAFSSDAVPMHLLTKEALETYARRLQPGGLLMIHISNRFMRLEPVLAEAARHGWTLMARQYEIDGEDMAKSYSSSLWIALARDQRTIDRLAATSGPQLWRPVAGQAGFGGWTDDYASILPLLKWNGK